MSDQNKRGSCTIQLKNKSNTLRPRLDIASKVITAGLAKLFKIKEWAYGVLSTESKLTWRKLGSKKWRARIVSRSHRQMLLFCHWKNIRKRKETIINQWT